MLHNGIFPSESVWEDNFQVDKKMGFGNVSITLITIPKKKKKRIKSQGEKSHKIWTLLSFTPVNVSIFKFLTSKTNKEIANKTHGYHNTEADV